MALVQPDHEKYEVLEVIGRGAFGIIRKVRRKADGHVLCRKEINYVKMSQKERDQLHAEFSILQSLKHENIVGYFHREHLKQTQDLFIYMEYCGGGDLGSVIKNLKLSGEYAKEDFVWRTFSQLIAALYRCHYGVDAPEPGSDMSRQKDTRPLVKGKDQGMMILHRDLKPENIFLGDDQSVKLGDFGLSKLMASHDFASTYVGTPYYMSPEICAAEKYTLQSDIWAVGCIMYELCTKKPPFDAKTHISLIQKIRKGYFEPLPTIYSRDLQNVIANCLKVNPLQRPDTASLLTVPYIWISRKQQELVNISRVLKSREDTAELKLYQAEERLSAMESDREAIRVEVESQLRREWEVKARLEIDRQTHIELEKLRKKFDKEVEEKVKSQIAKHTKAQATSQEQQCMPPIPPAYSNNREHMNPQSSVNTVSGDEDFPSTTDLTDLSELSIHSLAVSSSTSSKPFPPRKAKTPFSRSKTTFDSPADIQMSEPSPISISSLALSPRRNAATQAAADATFKSANSNIFVEAAKQKSRWEPTLAYTDDDSDLDSDNDGIPDLPSPTRLPSKSKMATDPFKMPMKGRPAFLRQNTTATMQKLTTQPSLFPTSNATAQVRVAAIASGIPRSATDNEIRSRSPQHRRLSKIPSNGNLNAELTSPTRRTGLQSKLAGTGAREDMMLKAVQTRNLGGRTLVELSQARAGGRSLSSANLNGNGMKGVVMERDLDLDVEVPVWDPMVVGEECMPSPFLKRDVRNVGMVRGLR